MDVCILITVICGNCLLIDEIVIILIKEKPGNIAGLDENGFVSSRNLPKSKSDIYVMSEAVFKAFELNGGRRYD